MEEAGLKTLTAEFPMEVKDKTIQSLSARETPVETSPEEVKTADPTPKKRTSYNHLLQKPGSHASSTISRNLKTGLNSNDAKARVASHPLSSSPKVIRPTHSPGTISSSHKRAQTADFSVRSRIPVSKSPENGKKKGVQPVEEGTDQDPEAIKSFSQTQRSFLTISNQANSVQKSQFSSVIRETEGGSSLADSRRESGIAREQIDAYVSALSPHFFQDLRTRQTPTPEVEMVIHAFLSVLQLQEPNLDVPKVFKVMHHKTWKAFLSLSAHSGKLVQPVKSLPTAIKRGKFPSSVLSPILSSLQSLPIEKIAADDAGSALFHYVETAVLYAKACEIERERETNSLQFLQLKDSSPRRKLLVSLMNRSEEQDPDRTEGMEGFKIEAISMVEKVDFAEEKKQEFEEEKTAEIVAKVSSETTEEPAKLIDEISSQEVKPISTRIKKNGFHVIKPLKSPQKPKVSKTPTKPGKTLTPVSVKRPKPKPEPVPEEPIQPSPEQIRTTLLLDMKLRLFLQEKLFISKEISEPKTDLEAESLISLFRAELERSGEQFGVEETAAYVGKADLIQIKMMAAGIRSRELEALLSPQKSANSWTQMEIQRQKSKLTQTLTRLQLRKSLS